MDVKIDSIIGIPYSPTYLDDFVANPVIIIILMVVIIGYYTLFASLGVGSGSYTSEKGQGVVMFELILWSVFVLLILVNGMTYLFDFNIVASIRKLFTDKPEIDIIVDPDNKMGGVLGETTVPEIKLQKQVFHIPENNYNYNDAKAICRAYGGRLATWKEMKDAYDNGADWCSYGWSDGQMALFPTQYNKWAELQKVEGHEQDCGRPGINGGYISNPNVKFGINCYGYKPVITGEEVRQMAIAPRHPLTKREIEFEKKVDYWREKLPQIQVAPFNHNNWSVV
jgi:hypothetical protein